MARTRFWVCVHCGHDLIEMTLVQCYDLPFGHGQQSCEILSRLNLAIRAYDPDTDLGIVYCDLDLGDLTLGQGYDTSFGHRQ